MFCLSIGRNGSVNIILSLSINQVKNSVTRWFKPNASDKGLAVLSITAARGRYCAAMRNKSLLTEFPPSSRSETVDTERAPKWQDVVGNLSDGELQITDEAGAKILMQRGKPFDFLFGLNQCFNRLNPTNHPLFTLLLNTVQTFSRNSYSESLTVSRLMWIYWIFDKISIDICYFYLPGFKLNFVPYAKYFSKLWGFI